MLYISEKLFNAITAVKHESRIAQTFTINPQYYFLYNEDSQYIPEFLLDDLNESANFFSLQDNSIAYYTSKQITDYVANRMSFMFLATEVLLKDLTTNVKPTVTKPAKVMRKFIIKDYETLDYALFGEVFNNYLIKSNSDVTNIEIISGEDIRTAYLEDNYFSNRGSLYNSCMKHKYCQPYLDLYCNEKFVKLIVLRINGMVAGRCLLWDDKYRDRIYGNSLAFELAIAKFCDKMGYIDIYSNREDIQLSFNLTANYRYYPYMDSIAGYDSESNLIYNTYDSDDAYTLQSMYGVICEP